MAKHFLSDRDVSTLRQLVRDYNSGAFFQFGARSSRKQLPAIQEVAIGVTDEAIAPGESGDVTKWTVTDDEFAEVAPEEMLEAYDWTEAGFDADQRVILARIAHGEGTRWILVAAVGGMSTVFVKFTTTTGFSAGLATATVNDYWGGPNPGSTVTVRDKAGGLEGQSSGIVGVAVLDASEDEWPILYFNPKTLSNYNGAQTQTLQHNTSGLLRWDVDAGGGSTHFIHFSTTGAFSGGEATADVTHYWGGPNPGSPVTVIDTLGDLDGHPSGVTGIATYDDPLERWTIIRFSLKSLTGYAGANNQTLSHNDSGVLTWYDLFLCSTS